LEIRVESEERLRPDGTSAAGRSSANPATARKAEEKKREWRTQRDEAGRTSPVLFGKFGAFIDHAKAYTVAGENWQGLLFFQTRLQELYKIQSPR
jgi:hypothetical protein